MRKALFKAYYGDGRFKLNETEDACEAFEALLGALHRGASVNLEMKAYINVNVLEFKKLKLLNSQAEAASNHNSSGASTTLKDKS